MTEQEYWFIIDKVRLVAGNSFELYEQLLRDELAQKSEDEIEAFDLISLSLFSAAYKWEMVDAAKDLAGHCSDDGLVDFIGWIISRGRSVYYNALESPSSLKTLDDVEAYFFEGFLAIPSLVANRDLNADWEFPELRD
jgi:hypothetical protein